MKHYTIICDRANGSILEKTDTLNNLIEYYSYKLGYLKEKKPSSIKSLIQKLNKASDIKYAACYNRDIYRLKESTNGS